MKHPLSNVEFMLLQMIKECGQASGYDLKKLVDQRGYREWANIGTTSIYAGLKKLNDKGWIITVKLDEKSGKGPMPNCFTLTEAGNTKLKQEILDSLSSARERDRRFDLGLSALAFVKKEEAVDALRNRLDFLLETSQKIEQKYESQGGVQLPLNVRALFLHSVGMIEHERTFVSNLIRELLEETEEYEENH